MTLGDLIRDSSVGRAMFGARYGERDPHRMAVEEHRALGYPAPGAEADEGEAQRYAASRIAAERLSPVVPLLMNPIHEGVLSWFAEGEGGPSMKRLQAGWRGALDAAEAQPDTAPVRAGFGLEGAQISAARQNTIGALLGSILAGR